MKLNSTAMTIFFSVALFACEDETPLAPQDKTTAGGWNYRYMAIPEKKDGWKISILADSAWNYEDHNAWAAVMAPHMLAYSGYGDVSPADKAALFEDMESNAIMFQDSANIEVDMYIKKGEEEAFMEAIIAMLHDYELDAEYFETLKTQFTDNINEAEAQKVSGYVADKIMSYMIFERDNDVITAYDLDLEALEVVNLEDVEAWIQHVKSLSGLRIGVAGAEGPETIEPYLDALLAGISQDPNSVEIPPIKPASKVLRVAYENPEAEKTTFTFSSVWPEKIQNDENFMVLDYAVLIQDGNATKTRLASIREELRASYGFSSYYYPVNNTDYFYGLDGESDLDHQKDVLERLLSINEEMIDMPPSEKEFEAAKSDSLNEIKESYQDENMAAYVMAISLDPELDVDWLGDKARYENSTREDIAAKISVTFPKADQWHQVIVTPDASGLDADCVITDWKKIAGCYE